MLRRSGLGAGQHGSCEGDGRHLVGEQADGEGLLGLQSPGEQFGHVAEFVVDGTDPFSGLGVDAPVAAVDQDEGDRGHEHPHLLGDVPQYDERHGPAFLLETAIV